MSLRVWLPLVRDLNNQGLSDVSVTNSGTTIIDNGKLGKCCNFSAGNMLTFSPTVFQNFKEVSISLWLNINAWNTAWETYFQFGLGTAPWNSYNLGLLRSNTASKIAFVISNNSSSTQNQCISDALTVGTWYHVTCVYKTGHCMLYVNGALVRDISTTIVPNFAGITNCNIGRINASQYDTNCKMNDFRIYDHALSAKEVKELSKGLVAHYTLGDRYASENLIINGFGELGTENWESASLISTTEIPSAIDTNIKESFYNSNIIKEFIPLGRYNTYTISTYIKAVSGATRYSYPSIFPYDADKNFIATFNCLEGFSSTYKTTLSQPLHKGDTVIHATDLSAWTTGDNYYFHVAIFGYKNSFGYTYPDMEYTQDSPKFGSRTDKSNINKTNNTITLLSAYTGEDRPAGTVICQATEGSTYWYPFGGINPSTVPDWTFKTCTFTPNSVNRLRWAMYAKYMAYSNVYHAGIKLVDNADTDRTIYDCSGYNYHGEQWAYDTKGNIVSSSVTPRYSYSTYINSDSSASSTATGTQMIYCPCALTTPNYLTIAFWCKPIAGLSGTTSNGQFALTNNDIGLGAATDYASSPMHHRDTYIDMTTSGSTHKTLTIAFTANEWHHYAIVYDGRYGRTYIDGVAGNTLDMGSNISLKSMKAVVLGYSHAGGVYRKNKSYYSDFRLYSTALSADDIKELYHTSASIDKDGNLYAYELKEE